VRLNACIVQAQERTPYGMKIGGGREATLLMAAVGPRVVMRVVGKGQMQEIT